MSSALTRDVLLRDGSTLRLQAAVPADFDDLREFFDGLSPESRYMRFHSYGRSDVAARAAAEAAGPDRAALIGRHNNRIVAVAGFDGLREPRAAEVAFAVADDWQHRGAATRMLEQLAGIAGERGITRFDAEVLADNWAMLGVLGGAGFALRRKGSFGEVRVSLDIRPTEAVRDRVGERDHRAAIAGLRPILAPASIAVLCAATARGSLGRAVLENIVAGGFSGVVTPVSRSGGMVCSMPVARSLAELDVAPELVLVCAAGEELLAQAAEAASAGTKALVLLPAGTQSGGPAVGARVKQLLEIVRRAGVRMVGPNSLGVVNTAPDVSLNATFSGASVRPGGLAIGSQSAALGIGLLGHAEGRQLGVSVLMALGEPADVSTNDLLEWCDDDERTTVVILYVETFGDPSHFTRIARRVARKKPILAVKGRGRAQRAHGGAHTLSAAALHGDAVADALLHQAGVLRFRSGEAMFDAAQLFESQPLPGGRRVGVVSNSAGMAAVAADACATRGLELQEGGTTHPAILGIGAGPDEYATSIRELLSDPDTDALMVYYVDHRDGDPDAILAVISAACAESQKPVVASVVRSDGQLPPSRGSAIPNFLFPESCAAVLARAAERREWLARPLGQAPQFPDLNGAAARALIAAVLDHNPEGCWLSRDDARALLASFAIPVIRSDHCRDLTEVLAVARQIGSPLVLTADRPAEANVRDVGANVLGLEGVAAVRAGWRELERRARAAGRDWTGAVVRPLAEPGADVLLGAVSDRDLGSVMALGIGGRHAGLAGTVSFSLPPATDVEADELIDSSAGVTAQLDAPGSDQPNRAALRELILRFALLLGAIPEVAEADLNPVRCTPAGCLVLDLRMRIERPRRVEHAQTW